MHRFEAGAVHIVQWFQIRFVFPVCIEIHYTKKKQFLKQMDVSRQAVFSYNFGLLQKLVLVPSPIEDKILHYSSRWDIYLYFSTENRQIHVWYETHSLKRHYPHTF